MDIFLTILSIVAFSIVVLVVYNVLKAYVLHKVNINKWIVLVSAVTVFLVPMLIWPNMPRYIANYIIPGIFVVLFLWFMDLSGFMKKRNVAKPSAISTSTKKDKKNDVVIRPKAKPNRVKNNQKLKEK
jgi:CDP-diglyceride synthetase